MFGRRKNKDVDVEETDEEALDSTDETEAAEDPDEVEDDDAREDETYRINLEREDGPFDIDEVDLDADDIARIDFGSLIVTPFENMEMQIQVDQETGQVQSLLVVQDGSAIEVALFAAPANGQMIGQVHEEMIEGTESQGGDASVTQGILGAELRRVVPMEGPDGEQGYHVSRSWLAQGPRWLLRGVLMGSSAMEEELDPTGRLLLEFFCNLVVRRDDRPRVPGDIITLQMPADLAPEES
ncbi:DUF3710 domain-containing protein [Acidipropionibacterium virtanenii]|uniref:DUF3710 domain-containing protein n=1 Tax=Acidipropionibacterium virtanenii TaxID=2057246 RepID=UPI000DECE300|nr:DUF3710 domain-containing protein [Acidipropionibacterium virtanenii]